MKDFNLENQKTGTLTKPIESQGISKRPIERSHLPPVVTNPNSPYFSETGAPVTIGDYEQRVKNVIKMAQRKRFTFSFNWKKSPYFVGGFLLASTTAAVYCTNVLIVYEKERLIEQLLAERNRLRILNGNKP
jgi:hypothetical protein